jgi:hypothetical protein
MADLLTLDTMLGSPEQVVVIKVAQERRFWGRTEFVRLATFTFLYP